MKKKFLVLAAAFMLMFSFAGQAMAAFTAGELIRVVYVSAGAGNEVATDMGAFNTYKTSSAWTTDTPYTTNDISLSSSFSGYGYGDLYVAYFVRVTAGNQVWISGTPATQFNIANHQSSLTNLASTENWYGTLTNASSGQVTGSSSYTNSYWKLLDNGKTSAAGTFNGFIAGGGEINLAALASGGYVDQYLYYYSSSVINSNGSGVAIADLRTYLDANGKIATEIIPINSTPIPAAVWLLGSGLIGLVGIRRRAEAV